MKRYRKKPVFIEAFQLKEDFFTPFVKNKEEKFKSRLLPDGRVQKTHCYIVHVDEDLYINVMEDKHTLFVKTLEGDMKADLNDWIITGVIGERYPCKPDVFAVTYELVE